MTWRIAISRRGLQFGVTSAVLLGVVAYSVVPGLADALAYLSPALLLLLVLATRRYPGERALIALTVRGHRRRHHVDAMLPRPHPRALLPRGGRLIAASLAVRPPPAHGAVALI